MSNLFSPSSLGVEMLQVHLLSNTLALGETFTKLLKLHNVPIWHNKNKD